MTTWQSLHKKFNALGEKIEGSVSDSFFLSVVFGKLDSVSVTLGTSEIPGWDRVTHIGPYSCEQLALVAVKLKIAEAEKAISTNINFEDM